MLPLIVFNKGFPVTMTILIHLCDVKNGSAATPRLARADGCIQVLVPCRVAPRRQGQVPRLPDPIQQRKPPPRCRIGRKRRKVGVGDGDGDFDALDDDDDISAFAL